MGEGSALKTQLPRMLPDCLDDPLRLGESLFIAEPEDGPAEAFQFDLSEVVSQYDVIQIVDSAVDLEDQPEPIAGEVGEIPADRVLAAEAMAVDLRAAEALPQTALGQTGGLALIARESCSSASHDAIIACLRRDVRPLSLWERA